MREVRVELTGITVRLFSERSEAIGVANARTRLEDLQHNAVRVKLGWLVKSVEGRFYDAVGEISPDVAERLK
jgi:hypothetical protein